MEIISKSIYRDVLETFPFYVSNTHTIDFSQFLCRDSRIFLNECYQFNSARRDCMQHEFVS